MMEGSRRKRLKLIYIILGCFGRKLGFHPTIFNQLFIINRECAADCVDAAGVAVDVAQSI